MIPTAFKKKFRNLYYTFFNDKIVNLQGYPHLKDYKWILNKNYGRAYYTGEYEPRLCNYLLNNLSGGSVFIDIGSHAGYFSMFSAAIAKNGKVISFEPEPGNFAFINKINELNKVENWTVINKAVGNQSGSVSFTKGPTTSTGKIEQNGNSNVPITSIDKELPDISRIDIMKIDVEGFGGEVIKGAIKTIERLKPKLMIEIHANSDEKDVVLSYLSPFYFLKNIDDNKIVAKQDDTHFIIGEPIV